MQILAIILSLLGVVGLGMLVALIVTYFTDNSDPDLPETLPKKGEKWGFKDGSPWPREDWPVEIIEVEGYWIRYNFGVVGTVGYQSDRRELLESFVCRFAKIEDTPKTD